eukprot:CAMPEP_0181241208 /NCGR_PEP_ID=MMETSP1096-20121128/40991_1 /TAXON_ID=156174 ORGANISM="Chrysochromulina ericina, Strain CCMP281" /NCGR_SAMPLE_ID=MMETSP1096 /ASSEMBLY_ACC=CAM_ASM_000453 /LENGTH=75 /DNA_ID=CAMNT_0023337249 /DNA_START=220 /DNA_END=444 /DNA_ORIENTATION=-
MMAVRWWQRGATIGGTHVHAKASVFALCAAPHPMHLLRHTPSTCCATPHAPAAPHPMLAEMLFAATHPVLADAFA